MILDCPLLATQQLDFHILIGSEGAPLGLFVGVGVGPKPLSLLATGTHLLYFNPLILGERAEEGELDIRDLPGMNHTSCRVEK